MRRALALVGAALLAACASTPSGDATVLLYDVELDAAAAADDADAQRMRVSDLVAARLDGAGLPFRGSVELREDGVLRVELSGPDDPAARALARELIERADRLEIGIVATPRELDERQMVEQERRLRRHLAAHPDAPLAAFHALSAAEGGPTSRLFWARSAEGHVPILRPTFDHWHFGSDDIVAADVIADEEGRALVAVSLRESRRADFQQYTSAHVDRILAVVLDGTLVSSPALVEPIVGAFGIAGLEPDHAEDLARALTSEPLPASLRPRDE